MAKSENGAAVTYVHDAAGEVLEGHIAFGAGKTRTKATKAKTKAPSAVLDLAKGRQTSPRPSVCYGRRPKRRRMPR